MRARPGDGALVRGQRGHVDAVDEDCARGRAIEAGDDVERRRLAAAVGADQRMHAAAPHGEIDAVDRLQAAEIFGEASDLQRDAARRNRRGAARAARPASTGRARGRNSRPTKPQMPSGMKMTIRMTARP